MKCKEHLTNRRLRSYTRCVKYTLHKDNDWGHHEPTEAKGEQLPVAEPDERYTDLSLERRLGRGDGADGVRPQVSLESRLGVHALGGRPGRRRGDRHDPGQ